MKYSFKFFVLLIVTLICSIAAFGQKMNFNDVKSYKGKIDTTEHGYVRLFPDRQNVQIKAAKKLGIIPQTDDQEIKKLLSSKKLVRVENNSSLKN